MPQGDRHGPYPGVHVSNHAIALIADIGSFIVMLWVLDWNFIVAFALSIGIYYATKLVLDKTRGKS
jgi:hypothetical protein